jgi:hypothetical protein
VVVDATGDADVACRAGAPCESGRRADGLNQAVSLRFNVGNVDREKAAQFLRANGLPQTTLPTVSFAVGGGGKDIEHVISRAVEDDVVDEETMRYFQFFSIAGRPGEVTFNCPEFRNQDPVDPWHLSRVQTEGRRKIRRIIHFCRTCLPGFEQCYLLSVAPMVGVRSSRRIIGEYVLTEEDVLAGRRFDDAVARNNWPPDVHAPGEEDDLVLKDKVGHLDYVEVPYRCLLPLGIENLLVAGRCISATFEAQAAIRISRTCQALGQAAGTAAAMAARGEIKPRDLDGRLVHDGLDQDGLFGTG